MKKILLSLLLLMPFIFIHTNCTNTNSTKAAEKKELSISFIGDLIMHIPVQNCAKMNNIIDPETKKSLNNDGFDFLFEEISPVFLRSDLTVANMEFPVALPYTSEPWIFNCQPSVLPALTKAGISAVTIANNHILDQGQNGTIATIEALKKDNIDYIGVGLTEEEAKEGFVFTGKGISVGILACTGVMNWPMPKKKKVFINWFYDEDKMLEDIKAIRQKSDYVVLVVHTGVEYMPFPEEKDRRLMKKYLDAGADLIIGHHPHIVQPVETYTAADGRETCIFYSLGNFISNQSSEVNFPQGNTKISTRNGLIVTVKLDKYSENQEDLLRTKFQIIPVKTVNIRETAVRKRQIQTMEFSENETVPPIFLLSDTALDNGKTGRTIEVLGQTAIETKKILPKKTKELPAAK